MTFRSAYASRDYSQSRKPGHAEVHQLALVRDGFDAPYSCHLARGYDMVALWQMHGPSCRFTI